LIQAQFGSRGGMILVGASGQATKHYAFRADGSITTGGTPQLLLPETETRSFFVFQNNSSAPLWLEFGCARAHATVSGGVVTAVTVDNGGFGFTLPPKIDFIGGLAGVTSTSANSGLDIAQPGPRFAYGGSLPASAVAVLGGGAVTSITVTNGGKGYTNVPMVFLHNIKEDPFGCADPSSGSGSGVQVIANGGSYYVNGTACPTDAIAVYGANTSQKFTCMWMR
jgi:hypothetical protein